MKKLFAILLALALVLSMAACAPVADKQDETTDGNTGKELASFTVVVVHGDGTEKTFTYETSEQFVGPVLQKEGLIQGNDGQFGLEITHVDGEQAIYDTDKAYWAVYEGDEYAMQGIDTTPVVDGQTYKLVYTGA